jgi:hypothetical protein
VITFKPCQPNGDAMLAELAISPYRASTRVVKILVLYAQLEAIRPATLHRGRDRPLVFVHGLNTFSIEVVLAALERTCAGHTAQSAPFKKLRKR